MSSINGKAVTLLFALCSVMTAASPATASYPGRNGRIAFPCPDFEHSICTVKPNGSDLRRLVGGPEFLARYPVWSPDGKRLLFQGTSGERRRLYVGKPDGTNLRVVLDGSLQDNPVPWGWSPDGSKILFSDLGTSGDLFPTIMDVGEGLASARPLVRLEGVFSAAWSPTGEWVALTVVLDAESDPEDSEIFLVRPDGTDLHQLTRYQQQTSSSLFPEWSPDGRYLALLRMSLDYPNGAAYVMRIDPKARPRFLAEARSPLIWSPDGSKIATYGWPVYGTRSITLELAGTRVVRVPTAPWRIGDWSYGDWQPRA